MSTFTLSDGTTTITFDSFPEIQDRYDAKYFKAIAIPDNAPAIIIVLQAWLHMLKISFQILNDSNYPGAGDSAADKWAELVDLLKTGGQNAGQFTLVFDSEDSTPGDQQTETYEGSVKNLEKRSVAGEHTVKIDGSFEFYEGIVS